MRKMIRLSVIIVTYNCYDLLKKSIESIFRYNDIGDALELIVVDNGDDGSYEKIGAVPECEKVISFKHENTGYGAGNNAGAEISNGDVLLFLNPDTELIEPVFRYAIDAFDNDPDLGSFGVRLLDKDRNRAPSGGFRLHMGFWKVQLYRLLDGIGVFLPKSMFTCGADLFIRKKAFIECGKFDEGIFMYCEEADISNRLNGAGWKIAFFPDKKIVHMEGSTSADSFPKKYGAVLKAREYYCRKYGVDFKREAKKELRYCGLKAAALRMIGRTEASDAYSEVVKTLQETIAGLE